MARSYLVPPTPIPLVPVDDDPLVDALFGEGPPLRAGWLDAALVIGGIALIVTGLPVLGAVVVVLGAVLPLRSWGRRRARAAGARVLVAGGAVDELVAAYGELWRAGPPDAELADPAHGAVREVAVLLAGRPVRTIAEVALVTERARLIRAASAARPARSDGVATADAYAELDRFDPDSPASRLSRLAGSDSPKTAKTRMADR